MFLFMLCLFLISFFRILSSLPLCQVCLHSETPSEGRLVFYKEKCDITQGFRFKNVIECLKFAFLSLFLSLVLPFDLLYHSLMHLGFAVFIVIVIGGEDVDQAFFGKAERAQMARQTFEISSVLPCADSPVGVPGEHTNSLCSQHFRFF